MKTSPGTVLSRAGRHRLEHNMNIFYLDQDPVRAARYHCDKHVRKMIVETAQILSKIHWELGYDSSNHVEHGTGPYRACRSVADGLGPRLWVMDSLANYRWAVRLGLALCDEFERRFRRDEPDAGQHKTKTVLEWLRDHVPDLPDVGPTTPKLAFDPEYTERRDPDDPVESYRDYYRLWKRQMKRWPPGETPEWFDVPERAKR